MRGAGVLLLSIVVVGLSVGGPRLGAAEPDRELGAEQVLQRVQRWLDDTRDLQARFEQSLESGVFGDAVTESGRLWIARPGKMRWEYLRPEPKLALVRDGKTWLYLEEDRQLQLGVLDEDTRLLPTLLAGEGRLDELFRASLIEPADEEAASRAGEYLLRLVPVDAGAAVEEVVVHTGAPSFAVDGLDVLDAAGNWSTYRFTRIRRNRGLNDDLFRFEPGPDVEISGSHEP
jgi:outer membrane lipoprotein carrier protein